MSCTAFEQANDTFPELCHFLSVISAFPALHQSEEKLVDCSSSLDICMLSPQVSFTEHSHRLLAFVTLFIPVFAFLSQCLKLLSHLFIQQTLSGN